MGGSDSRNVEVTQTEVVTQRKKNTNCGTRGSGSGTVGQIPQNTPETPLSTAVVENKSNHSVEVLDGRFSRATLEILPQTIAVGYHTV